MNRADFWCRVLGWLQLGGAVVCGATIYWLWQLLFGWIDIKNGEFFEFILWLIILFFALPPFVSGLLTVLFANVVEQSREGLREQSKPALRIFLTLAGLWTAGVVGFAGLSFPHLGFFAVMGLMSAAIAIMGADWTADLFRKNETTA
jgi:hypothetical protein